MRERGEGERGGRERRGRERRGGRERVCVGKELMEWWKERRQALDPN